MGVRFTKIDSTIKLGFKERLNKEQLGNSETIPVTPTPDSSLNK